MNKKISARAAGPLSGLKGKFVIGALALMLALMPSMAHAGAAAGEPAADIVASVEAGSADDASGAEVTTGIALAFGDDSVVQPPRFADNETRPTPPVDEGDDADHTMTFYYCDPMGYEDPDYDDPSGIKLLKKVVVTGLKAGDVLNTADYVEHIDGYFFFDAYPVKPVVSSDESLNYVELTYFKTRDNAFSVDYYQVKGQPGSVVGDEAVAFEKMGTLTVDDQPFDLKVDAARVAVPIENMVCLDAYPESIRLKSDADENVINVFYADAAATLPDSVPAPDDTGSGVDKPGTPDVDQPGAVPPTGGGSGDADAGQPQPPASDDEDNTVPPADDDADAVPPANDEDDADAPAGDDAGPDGSAGDSADADRPAGDAADGPAPEPEVGQPADPAPAEDAAGDDREPQAATPLAQTGDPMVGGAAVAAGLALAGGAALTLSRRRLAAPRR